MTSRLRLGCSALRRSTETACPGCLPSKFPRHHRLASPCDARWQPTLPSARRLNARTTLSSTRHRCASDRPHHSDTASCSTRFSAPRSAIRTARLSVLLGSSYSKPYSKSDSKLEASRRRRGSHRCALASADSPIQQPAACNPNDHGGSLTISLWLHVASVTPACFHV